MDRWFYCFKFRFHRLEPHGLGFRFCAVEGNMKWSQPLIYLNREVVEITYQRGHLSIGAHLRLN